MNMKKNIIPRGMIQLERIFDQDQINEANNQTIEGDQYEKVNLGTEEEAKNVCIGKAWTLEEKIGII